MDLLLAAIVVLAISGVPGLFLSRHSNIGQVVATILTVAAAGFGLAQTLALVSFNDEPELRLPWAVPGGELHVALDGLSAVFLLPIFLISLLGSIYGLGYWKQSKHADNGRKLSLFYGLMAAAMALLVLARNAVLFLTAWEVMALSAFFLVATEDHEEAARAAGWLYLAAAHAATLCLFALFALWHTATGTFTLEAPGPGITVSVGLATAIFLLAVAGFGLKAGIMPLHVWLPSSHATAPSHVSALMSGVILKMGVYGLVRICSLLPQPPVWWGGLLLGLGVLSGVLGVAFAIGQHDLKRLLAYHSIENIGIIVMGLGLALVGRSLGQASWVLLGLGGALLHVWNHALFKALLFYCAGSVIHAVHTREIDDLGGLGKAMPRTALCFLIGAVAICGLPPLNGFVSELLIYLGLFRTLGLAAGTSWPGGAFAVPALALIGALAVACFVKVYGAVFLGTGRSEHAQHAHESGPSLVVPMAVLAACCLVIGLAPAQVIGPIEQAVHEWSGTPQPEVDLVSVAPLEPISVTGGLLIAFLLVGWLLLARRTRGASTTVTWDCGYAAPSPRMQYTSSSFAEMVVGLFAWALRPRIERPKIDGLFPGPTHFRSDVPDTVLEGAVLPSAGVLARAATGFRVLQQGSLQAYLLYIVAIVLVLLLWG
jgi:formate hydrogenlyase subunit 3/multisubunit Na+/H+ antiporter MnhD subunit